MSAGGAPLRLGASVAEARAVCVFVHGRGQSPEEMQSHVLARLSAPAVAFVLPRAAAGAWWDARAVDPLTEATSAQLGAALDQIAGDIAVCRAEFPGRRLLLAGFSQGACLAIEYLCAGLAPPDAVAAFTGCRVGVVADPRPEAVPAGVSVYLSGGDADPWISVAAFADAVQSLGSQGVRLRADLFPDRAHTVSDAEIVMLDCMLADLAAGRAPRLDAAR